MTAGQHGVPAIFGQRVKRERERHRWSMRDLQAKSGVSQNTLSRAERGHDLNLGNAIMIAEALGLSLGTLLTESACTRCDDSPPAGFICGRCGRGGAT